MSTFYIYRHDADQTGSPEKKKIVSAIWSAVNSILHTDKQIQKFAELSQKCKALDHNEVIDQIRKATTFDITNIRNLDELFRVRIRVSHRQLRNGIGDRVDGYVGTLSKRRTSYDEPAIPFIQEIISRSQDVEFVFNFNIQNQEITGLQNLSRTRRSKADFLERVYKTAIEEFGQSLFFEDF